MSAGEQKSQERVHRAMWAEIVDHGDEVRAGKLLDDDRLREVIYGLLAGEDVRPLLPDGLDPVGRQLGRVREHFRAQGVADLDRAVGRYDALQDYLADALQDPGPGHSRDEPCNCADRAQHEFCRGLEYDAARDAYVLSAGGRELLLAFLPPGGAPELCALFAARATDAVTIGVGA